MRMRTSGALLCALAFVVWGGCGGDPPEGRVLVLGIDGLDPLAIDLLMSEGKLPNLAKIRQEGAYGRLISQKPLLSPIIWTTIATGRPPSDHGIGHFVAVDTKTGEKLPVTSDMRRVRALWNIAAEAGRRTVVVGWWATWPPEPIDGVIVSDHTAYHFLFEDAFKGGREIDPKVHPPTIVELVSSRLIRPEDLGHETLSRFIDVDPDTLARPFNLSDDLSHFRWALATAVSYRDIGLELWDREVPGLAMVYIEGVDSTSHLFGHLFRTTGLSGELAAQQRRFGRAVEEMYRLADDIIGEYLAAMDEDTTLVVLSDHGFSLGELHDDPSRTRDMRRVSERFHRLEGVLYLYGRSIRRHARIDRPQLVDVAPTLLTLLGLPAADDMPGRVLSEALTVEGPPERIASYESGDGGRENRGDSRDATVDRAVVERLEALGYLGGGERRSKEGDRNLAAIAFEEGRYEEAVEMYRNLLAESPDETALKTSLAGALGALGRYDEGLTQLTEALELDPLNVEAYHNRAVIHERGGRPEEAIADYRSALRYAPDYEPSQVALRRLTGNVEVNPPRTAAESQARELAERAGRLARRGSYSEAGALLDRAQALAPDYSLIYQYRSNVAYLMGDRDAAIVALQRALELEPDNALFRQNLERLQAQGEDP